MSAIPTAGVTAIKKRDGCCIRCGGEATDTHHRQRRREGGHAVFNMIRLCGSGTTGCHGWVHANPLKAKAAGYIVPANGRAKPEELPVLAYAPGVEPHQSHVWFILDAHGGRERINHTFAQELLHAFGLIQTGIASG